MYIYAAGPIHILYGWSLTLNDGMISLQALAGIERRLPLLASVKVTGPFQINDEELIQVFKSAPRLQSVAIDGLYLDQVTPYSS
jgi:hypothetical protein